MADIKDTTLDTNDGLFSFEDEDDNELDIDMSDDDADDEEIDFDISADDSDDEDDEHSEAAHNVLGAALDMIKSEGLGNIPVDESDDLFNMDASTPNTNDTDDLFNTASAKGNNASDIADIFGGSFGFDNDDISNKEADYEDTRSEHNGTFLTDEDLDGDIEEREDGFYQVSTGRLLRFLDDGGAVYADEDTNSENFATDENIDNAVEDDDISIPKKDDEEDEIIDLPDEDLIVEPEANDFIDENGNLVVMSKESDKDTFEVKLVTYRDLAIGKRIRSSKNVEALAQSIRSTGLINPIVVAPLETEGKYVLIDGFRRVQACAKAGLKEIPAVINNKIKTTEITIVEAIYNHKKSYTMQDVVDYIEYLEKEKGITNPSMIEFLLDLDNGDYAKLKDIMADDDEDIVEKLLLGQITIAQAFKALEKRRAKESKDEKELKKVAKVYGDTEESGIDVLENSGEIGDEESALTDEQLDELSIDPTKIDNDLDEQSLDDMVQESNETPGFQPHQQKVGEREFIDPSIKKAVLARDNFTCACCKRGGESYVDALDCHHIIPVFLGGKDTPENCLSLCVLCHRFVHLFSTGDLHLPQTLSDEELGEMDSEAKIIYEDEQKKFKRIVKLGDAIRKGMAQQGINREQYKKDHPNHSIGRRKPGKNALQEDA